MKFLLMIVSDEKVDAARTPEEGMRRCSDCAR